ncbi:MAG: M20/M25/M40 family metallo-hydrolase [Desulfosudis oleivorans]|nr:M20/M25/M40 family metallo-hydrolase [Desulfosudis oleivorans]
MKWWIARADPHRHDRPPGAGTTASAPLLSRAYARHGYEPRIVEVPEDYVAAVAPELAATCSRRRIPSRVNVFARPRSAAPGRVLHFTGHFDVVLAGDGWSLDPFAGISRDGMVFGRVRRTRSPGLAASLFAIEALRRAGIRLEGTVEQSATVDEEYKGETGLGYLVREGLLGRGKQDFVVITECLDVDGICLGHRGGLFFQLQTHGRVGHGCMPQLAVNAVEKMQSVMQAMLTELRASRAVAGLPAAHPSRGLAEVEPVAHLDRRCGDREAGRDDPRTVHVVLEQVVRAEEDIREVRAEIGELLASPRARDPELEIEMHEAYSAEPAFVSATSRLVKVLEGMSSRCWVGPATSS